MYLVNAGAVSEPPKLCKSSSEQQYPITDPFATLTCTFDWQINSSNIIVPGIYFSVPLRSVVWKIALAISKIFVSNPGLIVAFLMYGLRVLGHGRASNILSASYAEGLFVQRVSATRMSTQLYRRSLDDI